jgi:hypothetical protein
MLPRPTRELAIAALILVLSATNGAAFRKLPAHGTVAGKSISTTVDSPLAKYYLENSLSPSGTNSELVATQEDGTIEENAATIAESIRAERRSSTPLILVSTSKGGPEVALALGKLLEPDETATVKAWVSVGGLIHGTFLANSVMGWPKLWLAKMAFSHAGVDPRSLPGLTTTASRKRMEQIRFPHHILVVQVIGAPLSGDIGDDVKDRYTKLRKYGPNDGLTLLADEMLPGGITVIEPGLDHFYRDPEIDLKFLALADVVGGLAAYSP